MKAIYIKKITQFTKLAKNYPTAVPELIGFYTMVINIVIAGSICSLLDVKK